MAVPTCQHIRMPECRCTNLAATERLLCKPCENNDVGGTGPLGGFQFIALPRPHLVLQILLLPLRLTTVAVVMMVEMMTGSWGRGRGVMSSSPFPAKETLGYGAAR